MPNREIEEIKFVADDDDEGFIIWQKDGSKMRLIEEGTFMMGSDDHAHESPVHEVDLGNYYIDVHAVTNDRYAKFLDETNHSKPKFWHDQKFNRPDQPVVGVTWRGSMAYAVWAEKRLPTEAEWEKAARGGLVGQSFPWGDKISDRHANFNRRIGTTTAVASYPPNGYGLFDMVGNTWEWCLDEYHQDFYQRSPKINPIAGLPIEALIANFENVRSRRVMRGGSFRYVDYFNRVTPRLDHMPDETFNDVGFRCVVYIPH